MIRISEPGPLMKEYAAIYGGEPQDVLDMVHGWCNGGPYHGQEETEKERLESSKAYIKSEVENSISGRIKSEIREAKQLKEAA